MALAAQALEAKKARKPLEQGGALEQVGARIKRVMGLTPRLTGAGARSAQGTNTGHKNAEGMASVGVRVEPPVRHFCNVMEPVYWVGKIFLFWL